MNEWDQDNLSFLLNSSPETLADWYEKMDKSDIDYAFKLLAIAKTELDVKEMYINDDITDTNEAAAVIAKIQSKLT